jgi:cell division protein FtsZ
MLEFDEVSTTPGARIKVIGVGGGGGNAINTMIREGLEGVEFIAANTDMQALDRNLAPLKIQLGEALTKGLGAGADPEIGRNSALEDQARLLEIFEGADMVFVTAGMGGGTGTGAAPVIANLAREAGALTVGVMTKPFSFEGSRRRRMADQGLINLQESVDTLITIPNQRLLAIAGENTSIIDAFRKADEVLLHAVQGISDLITIGGYVNVDFADVKTIMSNMGLALMGTGRASGPTRARDAAEMAISSPLLEDVSINGATGILINVTGGADLALFEINEASTLIQEAAHEDANIIFGAVIDEDMRDEIKITVIATGFDRARQEEPLASSFQQQGQYNSSGSWPSHQYASTQSGMPMAYGHQPYQPQMPSQHMQAHAQNFHQQPAAHQQPVAHQPVAHQPVAQQPVAQQPVAQQPVAQQPVAQQPAAPVWNSNPFRPAQQPQTAEQAPHSPQPKSQVAEVVVEHQTPQPAAGTPKIRMGGEPRRAVMTRPAQQESTSAQSSRRHGGGLSPVEEEELAIPTFLRNPKDRNR